jgi:hypothetical protein
MNRSAARTASALVAIALASQLVTASVGAQDKSDDKFS